jgi:hypothetical protein
MLGEASTARVVILGVLAGCTVAIMIDPGRASAVIMMFVMQTVLVVTKRFVQKIHQNIEEVFM